jgi:single-strand DNA-binding protein
MAQGLNKVILIGNLGMDPELRFTQGKQALLRMRIATTENFKNKSGEWQERTEWHTVIMWGSRAESINKFLSKGRTIGIEGRLQTRQWEDKDGNKRYTTEIVAQNVFFMGGGNRGRDTGTSDAPSYSSGAPSSPGVDEGPGFGGDYGDDFGNDDVPF